jgi:hypothetical protein
MRYGCHCCGKSVTSDLPDDSLIRAILVCPECLEEGRVTIPTDSPGAADQLPLLAVWRKPPVI